MLQDKLISKKVFFFAATDKSSELLFNWELLIAQKQEIKILKRKYFYISCSVSMLLKPVLPQNDRV